MVREGDDHGGELGLVLQGLGKGKRRGREREQGGGRGPL
jgi:hypothetical protein